MKYNNIQAQEQNVKTVCAVVAALSKHLFGEEVTHHAIILSPIIAVHAPGSCHTGAPVWLSSAPLH